MSYQAEKAVIDEEHEFDVQLTIAQALTPKLSKGLLAGERVTVIRLSTEDAPALCEEMIVEED